MKVIYIAGPFRGPNAWIVQQHIMAAMEAALEVWRLGAVAICPHANTWCFSDTLPNKVWLEGDYELIRRSDAVLALSGWQRSAGARRELLLAHRLGKPVRYSVDALDTWLRQPGQEVSRR